MAAVGKSEVRQTPPLCWKQVGDTLLFLSVLTAGYLERWIRKFYGGALLVMKSDNQNVGNTWNSLRHEDRKRLFP